MSKTEQTTKELLRIYLESGKCEQAVDLIEKALKEHPDDDDVVDCAALALSVPTIGRAQEGIKLLRNALELRGGSARLYTSLADCYTLAGEYQSAYETIAKAIELAPDCAELYARLGCTISTGFGVQADIQEAIEADRKAVELDPDNWEYRRRLGVDLWKTGDLSGASYSLEKALERIPKAEAEQRSLLKRWLRALKEGKSYREANAIT